MFLFLAGDCFAQTYQVGPGGSSGTKAEPTEVQNQGQANGQQLGWGSNIQNARLAGAAQAALQRGDHDQAVAYAQRAAQAAPENAQLWFLLGYAARLDAKLRLAMDAYNHGLRLEPSSLLGLSGLAQTYAQAGRAKEAEDLLKKVLAADPKQVDDAVVLGDMQIRSGDYQGALDTLGTAERMRPGARAELLMAIAYQHENKLDLSHHYLELAKARTPDSPDVERSLAGYYRETRDYKDALAELQSIRSPRPDVKAEMAYTYQLDGKQEQAARLYVQVANAMPRNLDLQLSAAEAEVAMGAMHDAQTFLGRAAAIDPNQYRLHAIRGEIARMEERDSDAVGEYQQALAHLPAEPPEGPLYGIQMHMDLMDLYRNLHEEDAAQQQLATAQRAIAAVDEQGPERASFLRLRALIRMNEGNLSGAESDLNQALALNAGDRNSLQLDGDLMMKLGHANEAIAVYQKILAGDPNNRYALTSVGYAYRAAGRDEDAEKSFQHLAHAYPTLYIPWLALGDLYTSRHDYAKAESAYEKGYALSSGNALIVAGGLNADIEAHKFDAAAVWFHRVTPEMQEEPIVLREQERYLTFQGNYQESAVLGERAIRELPRDRDVVVYLGYDLLYLNRYDELLKLATRYNSILSKEPDIPLLAGYVYKHNGQLEEARQDFSEALERDPRAETAYVNRGYVLHDLHQPRAAADDFESALRLEPDDSQAHLGLAYTSLDLRKPQLALHEAALAANGMPDSQPIHLIRATAYGMQGALAKAAREYRAAIRFTPNDGSLHLALANILYTERQFHEAVGELEIAQRLSPDNDMVYAWLARSWAELNDPAETMQYVHIAEEHAMLRPAAATTPPDNASQVFLLTGEALSHLGDQTAAMLRFRRALTMRDSDRVGVRLAIAQTMVAGNRTQEANREIALAMMEAEAGETPPPTGAQMIQAADLFRQMHDYQLSETYLQRAKGAGASDTAVHIGLANTYLALGDTARAQGELAAISSSPDDGPDYQYLLAEANVYRQEHQSTQALTAFAQASDAAGEDQTAEQNLLQAGGEEGLRLNQRISMLADGSVSPIFEDTSVYVLDSKLDAAFAIPPTDTSLLPPPRSSLQSEGMDAFHLHLNYMPPVSGFFQVRNATGIISVPATNSIVSRDTTDYSFNAGVNPTIHIGNNVLTFNNGVQKTVRRDSESPVEMNQNLFRLFTYMSTSSFFNAISVDGYVLRETGPFTESNLHSDAFSAAVDFRVGAPWGKTALVTGWGENDQTFTPVATEDYFTSSYIGLDRHFGDHVDVRGIAEDLRAWRTVGARSGIAQVLRPAGTFQYQPTPRWSIQAAGAWSNNRAFHIYDAVQSSLSLSYGMPFHREFRDESGDVVLQYPIRFSAGVQQEAFYNFTGEQSQQWRPYVSITLF
ncbi:MAG TPA: tetratricopeptide repeat protein [Acidobacteriaceae bacterium]|nr:tetratricopeptide repeat protein [Acidobacteriaceae bacterium]